MRHRAARSIPPLFTLGTISLTEALALTALIDSSFEDLLTVHDKVVATTCASTSIAVATSSTCTFDAKFCGGTHTDLITATLTDGQGNELKPPSNTLTVNASATTGP